MNDTVTILGRVGADPNRSATTTGIPVVNFRVASPQRRYDSKSQSWIETGTNWYNVSAFRQLADHAKASLRQGDGVIVTGKLKLREWESGGRKGMSADIEAEAIGHDLRWGASAYVKANSAASNAQPPAIANSFPPAEPSDDEGASHADVLGDDASAEEETERSDAALAFSSAAWTSGQ